MNILIYFYEFFKVLILLISNFQGHNIYCLYGDDVDIEYIRIEDTDYIASSATNLLIQEIDNEIPLPVEIEIEAVIEQPVIRPRRTARRCGYCREIGHYANDCNNAEVIAQLEVLNNLINDPNTTRHTIQQWMNDKSEQLVKVILCKMRLINFTSTMRKSGFLNVITAHRHEIHDGRIALQNIINNVNELVDGYRSEIQLPRLEMSDENVYNKLSITTSVVTNNSIDIICPICYDSIEQKNICKTDCNHEFCKDCVHKTLRDNIILKTHCECPLCRNTISHLFLSSETSILA